MSQEQPNQNLSEANGESSQPSVADDAAGGSQGSVKPPSCATMSATQNSNFEWNAPILLFVFGLIGLGAVSMAIGHGCYTLIRVSGAERVEGVLVGFVEENRDRRDTVDRFGSVRVPLVEYSMAGQRHRIQANGKSSWRVGRKLPVLVRSDRPTEGVVDLFAEKWGVLLIGCAIGFPPLLYATVGLVFRMRAK